MLIYVLISIAIATLLINIAIFFRPKGDVYKPKDVCKPYGDCLSISAGGGGLCEDLSLMKITIPTLHKSKEVTPANGAVKIGNGYKQVWTFVDVGDFGGANKRAIAVAYPTGTPPKGGWPIVLSLEFMNSSGMYQGWGGVLNGGLVESAPDGSDLNAHPMFFDYQTMLHAIVEAGYALVMISEFQWDNNFYMQCTSTDQSKGCWSDGNNPDATFYKLLIDILADDKQLDTSRFGVMGYSVGAQMVSRMINEFPTMRSRNNIPFPKIKGAVIIAGGSLWCYQYDGGKLPADFLPCLDPKIGCCPHNLSEINYDEGKLPWAQHPPVLLNQSKDDNYADANASLYYFNVMSSHGVPVYRQVGPPVRHGLWQCQIPGTINFLMKYV